MTPGGGVFSGALCTRGGGSVYPLAPCVCVHLIPL